MTGSIYLLRHGETEWNREGRMQGWLDSRLTMLGRVQAARQGAVLRRHGVRAPALCSPLGRARQTAALAGLDARPEPALREISMGDWQGIVPAAARAGVSWKFEAPGGETRDELVARLRPLLGLPRPLILVTHGVVVVALRAMLLGLPADEWDRLIDCQGVVFRISNAQERVL